MAVPPPPTTVRRRGSRVKEEEKAKIVRAVSIDGSEGTAPTQPENEVAAPASFHDDLNNLGQALGPEMLDDEVAASAQPEILDASFHDDLMNLGQAIRSLSVIQASDKLIVAMQGSQNPFDSPSAEASPEVNNHKSLQTNPFDGHEASVQVNAQMASQNPFDGHSPAAPRQPVMHSAPLSHSPVPPTHHPVIHHPPAQVPLPPTPTPQTAIYQQPGIPPAQVPVPVTPVHQPVIYQQPGIPPAQVPVTPTHQSVIYHQPEIPYQMGLQANQNPFGHHQPAPVPINHQPNPADIATQAPSHSNPFEQEPHQGHHGRQANQNPFDDAALFASITSNPDLPVAGQQQPSAAILTPTEVGIDTDFDVPLDGQKVLMTPQNSHDDLDDIMQRDGQNVLHTSPHAAVLQVPLDGEKVLMTPTQQPHSENLQVPLDGEKVIMTSSFEDIHVPLDGQKVIMTRSFEDNLAGHETSDDEGEEDEEEDESEGIDHSLHVAQGMLGTQSAAASGFC